ncbi:MAG: translation initiation factor IF-2 [Dehalococcoidales bacterium]|nr:translation initiation factor IF-2 [Dehalococcoidales bacterium]
MAELKKQSDAVRANYNSNDKEVVEKTIELPHNISVRQLSEMLKVTVVDVIKQLMRNGIMANINQVIDYDVAEKVAAANGYKAQLKAQAIRKSTSVISEIKKQQLLNEGGNLKPRPPVITIMGHVDHGKTRLLDAIRQTNVMDTEAGGITQHIGAYQVEINDQKITFLDTPGHEAFTAMRARGAQVTDITVLVVAADDGVQPQNLEAISHAKAAGVPIVVAINKIDKPEANPDIVKQQLAEAGLVVEEWGGDVIAIGTSAKSKMGIQELLENLLLVAEMENLRADPTLPAKGVVIEAEMDKNRGPLATILVHDGTLKPGDIVAVGSTWGRVKAMFNDTGKQVRRAKPSTPVVVLGLHDIAQVGDAMTAVNDEHQARNMVEEHRLETMGLARSANLSNLLDQVNAGKVKELNIIFKADVQGSIEPIRASLEKLQTDEVQVNIVHAGTGNVTETDVMLAVASKGLVVAFNTGIEAGAQHTAEVEGVDIRNYRIIYDMVDDVGKALKGMLEPKIIEVIEGHVEVRNVFPGGKKGGVAGAYVLDGKIRRGASVRVKRENKVVAETVISSLRRFKDDVKEVAAGYECGITLQDFDQFQIGDIFECYSREKSK